MNGPRQVRVVLEVPASVDPRVLVSDLQAWLTRFGATLHAWGPEIIEERDGEITAPPTPLGLFERTEEP